MSDRKKVPHESARYHVTGEATYVDDILANSRLLHGHVYTSPHAHARVISYDLSKARAHPGVYTILTYQDIPGENQMGPAVKDEVVMAEDEVTFVGQAMFLIAATDEATALEAAAKVEIEYEMLPAILTLPDAIERGEKLQPSRLIAAGDSKTAIAGAEYQIEGQMEVGGQEHWYLETQISLCIPG